MTWGAPWWLIAWLAVGAVAAVVVLGARAHHRRLAAVLKGDLLARVLPRSLRARRALRDGLALAGLALAVAALAEPRFGKEVRTIEEKGVDLVIAVDLSRSMDAGDVDPSRLQRAKREVHDLAEQLGGDRVGLVAYAGGAWPRMPLSRDHDALLLMVDELSTEMFEAQGSALGAALTVAMDLFPDDQPSGKAILVLSDGEAHDVDDALAAADAARAAGVRIYALGIGEGPAEIPLPDGRLLTDAAGRTVRTAPSPDLLREIAKRTGGAWIASVAGTGDVADLYADIRGDLDEGVGRIAQREVWKTAFQWPLGAGLLLLLAAAWWGDGRREP